MKKEIIFMAVVLLACVLATAQTRAGQSSASLPAGNQLITNGPVAEYVADSSATIGWSAQEGSGAMSIKYGSDRAHMTETAEAVPGVDARNFHARLQNLTPDTRYYFQVMQKGEPVGGVGTFRTVSAGATPIKSKATIPQ